MADRYTIEQLKNMDDISLSQKLNKSINTLCGIKNTLPKEKLDSMKGYM